MPSLKFETRRYVASGGVVLAADVGGDPDAHSVIFMHGGGQTHHAWRGAMRQVLAEGYHVVSIDARGHGDSDWAPTGKCDIESFAADLLVVDPLLDAATRVRIPTLPVRGLMSGIVSDAGVAELRDHLPALEVCDVAKAGHMLTGDRNDAFNHAVLGFLRRHAPL